MLADSGYPDIPIQPNEDPPPSLSGRVITLPLLADSEESPPLLTDSGCPDIPVQHSEDPPPSLAGGSMGVVRTKLARRQNNLRGLMYFIKSKI